MVDQDQIYILVQISEKEPVFQSLLFYPIFSIPKYKNLYFNRGEVSMVLTVNKQGSKGPWLFLSCKSMWVFRQRI